ncbi:MAG: retropepsin-like aspartic protease family protein [Methylocystis sp.]
MLGKQLSYAAVAVLVSAAAAKALLHLGPRSAAVVPPQSAQLRPVALTHAALPSRADDIRIQADSLGQFSTDVEVNGARIHGMLVDTGATLVALSYEDAAAAGLFPAPADYKYQVNTANGVAHVARVKLNDVRIGNIAVHGVDAVVGERGALSGSLLGMAFLSKLSRFSVESGALVLKQ